MIFNELYGVMNYLSYIVAGIRLNWLTDPNIVKLTVVVADVWEWTPFVFLVSLAGLMSIPQAPLEAAEIDGASKVQIFRYITLPLLKPVLIIVLLIRVMDLFKLFDVIWLLTYGGPGIATETTSLYAFFTAFSYFRLGYASAISYILLFIIALISTAIIRMIRRR
jgi:multiple sugar transport system permease protein